MSFCSECGSQAINPHLYGRDGTRNDLCDVHFWKNRYDKLVEKLKTVQLADNVRLMKIVDNIEKGQK